MAQISFLSMFVGNTEKVTFFLIDKLRNVIQNAWSELEIAIISIFFSKGYFLHFNIPDKVNFAINVLYNVFKSDIVASSYYPKIFFYSKGMLHYLMIFQQTPVTLKIYMKMKIMSWDWHANCTFVWKIAK